MRDAYFRIKSRIMSKGAISVSEYMRLSLYDRKTGYYHNSSCEVLGSGGDYITSPEISQIFGELIGLWCISCWHSLGEPEEFLLVDLGAGRGILLSDILRVSKLRPRFKKALGLAIVEKSSSLRRLQEENLSGERVLYFEEVKDLPMRVPVIILANEFFDCFPVDQFKRLEDGWHEVLVDIDERGQGFRFIVADKASNLSRDLSGRLGSFPADIIEVSFERIEQVSSISRLLSSVKGVCLVIDYSLGSTNSSGLLAVKDHCPCPFLSYPGLSDLSSYVDFEELKGVCGNFEVDVLGPIFQGIFLRNLGIDIRVSKLLEGADETSRRIIEHSYRRLCGHSSIFMGSLYKVMSIFSKGVKGIEGFA